jgi:hypothetical protein
VITLSWQRQLTSIIVAISLSCAALGVDTPIASGALLHSSGKVQVNGAITREVTTLLPGDSIQTAEDSVANITASGSSVLVLQNASITFLGPGVELTRGGLSVTTSEQTPISSYGLLFTPSERRQTKFEVVEYGDSVIVAAREGNLFVSDGQQTSMVPEGQESSHKKKGGAMPAADGSHSISGKTLAVVGAASGATLAGILIAQSNKKKKCVSASNNKKCKCTKDKHGNEDCEED